MCVCVTLVRIAKIRVVDIDIGLSSPCIVMIKGPWRKWNDLRRIHSKIEIPSKFHSLFVQCEEETNHTFIPILQQVYHNSSEVLAQMVESDYFGRLDMASVYYPSRYEVEWFISRTLVKLGDAVRKSSLPTPVSQNTVNLIEDLYLSGK